MKCYVGLDVGLRSTSLCIIDGDGTVRLERSVASEVGDIAGAIRSRAVRSREWRRKPAI
jgi:transposase